MSHRRGHRAAHGARPDLRDGGARHPRRPDPHVEERAPDDARRLRHVGRPRRGHLHGLRGRAHLLRRALPPAPALAHRLRDTFGVEKGDRVAIIMRNIPEWVVAFWGATLAGAVVVPLNAWWSGEELRYGLEDSGSKVAFVDTERRRARPLVPRRPRHPQGADRGGRAPHRGQGAAGGLRAARRHAADPRVALRPRARRGGRRRARRPTSPSTPRTTRRSSTPRGRRGAPRARSGRTATWSRTS